MRIKACTVSSPMTPLHASFEGHTHAGRGGGGRRRSSPGPVFVGFRCAHKAAAKLGSYCSYAKKSRLITSSLQKNWPFVAVKIMH